MLFAIWRAQMREPAGGHRVDAEELGGKKSRSWRRKGVVPRASPRSCRCWMRTPSETCKWKTGIRAGPDQAAQTAATIRPAHHASWRCRCRADEPGAAQADRRPGRVLDFAAGAGVGDVSLGSFGVV